MLNIQKKLIRYNYSTRNDRIKYIVIHTTGNTGKGSGVNNHYNYFNGGNRGASADYFVDDSNIGMFVEDKNYSWHCGDGKGKYGITNSNSIGIEICVNSDGDYNKNIENTVDLVQKLLKKYNLSINAVKRHYDASRKNCPREIIQGKNGITWSVFLDKVQNKTEDKPVQTNLYRVRESKDGKQFGAFSDLNNAIDCAKKNNAIVFDSGFKQVYPTQNIEKEIYRVRSFWSNQASQKGAFSDLDNAKKCADDYNLNVYNNAGLCIYQSIKVDKNAFWNSCNAHAKSKLNPRQSASFSSNDIGDIYSNEKIKVKSIVSDINTMLPIQFYRSSDNAIVDGWLECNISVFDIHFRNKVINVSSKLLARYDANSTSRTMGQVYNNESLLVLKEENGYKLCVYRTSNGNAKIAWFTAKYIK